MRNAKRSWIANVVLIVSAWGALVASIPALSAEEPPRLLLAETVRRDTDVTRYLVSEKLDGVRLAGRPIELRGESAWISRSDLRTLLTWAGTPGLKLTLWWLGAHYQVMFDAGEDGARAVESRPVFAYSDITDNELHTGLVLRFLTVE